MDQEKIALLKHLAHWIEVGTNSSTDNLDEIMKKFTGDFNLLQEALREIYASTENAMVYSLGVSSDDFKHNAGTKELDK